MILLTKVLNSFCNTCKQYKRYPLLNFHSKSDFENSDEVLLHFSNLDDYDIFSALKVWVNHKDSILSELSKALVNRRLFKIEMGNEPIDESYFEKLKRSVKTKFNLKEEEVDYFCFADHTSNYTYQPGSDRINILFKDGSVKDIAEVSDQLNITVMDKPTTKYFVCYPKGIV